MSTNNTTAVIYKDVSVGIRNILDADKAGRSAEANWVIEDITLLIQRHPKITPQLMKVAMHHAKAERLFTVNPELTGVLNTLRQFVSEMDAGKYPTLLSLHFNDGLAEEGWEPPPSIAGEVSTDLEAMRIEIRNMMQSPLLNKSDRGQIPEHGTEAQYAFLKQIINDRTVEAECAEPEADPTPAMVADPQAVDKPVDTRTPGEMIIEHRRLMVQCLMNPSAGDPAILEEAKAKLREGDVGLMQAMNQLTPDEIVINTISSALAYTEGLQNMTTTANEIGFPDPTPDVAAAHELAARIEQSAEQFAATVGSPKKATFRLKMDIKAVVESIQQDVPHLTLNQLFNHHRFITACTAERDTPANMYKRLVGLTDVIIPWPTEAITTEAECQSATTAETTQPSPSTEGSKPTELSVPQPEPSSEPTVSISPVSESPVTEPELPSQEKSSSSETTISSTTTPPPSVEPPAPAATPLTSTGSTSPSVPVVPTVAGPTSSPPTSSTGSAPTCSLSSLLARKKQIEADLAALNLQIRQSLKEEEESLGDRLKSIEEAKRLLGE